MNPPFLSYARPFLRQEVKELTAEDLLASSDPSEASTKEDNSFSEPELVADQLIVEAAKGNLINQDAWTPIATGPPQPVPPEFRVPPELRNLNPPPKKKQPARRSARICVTQKKTQEKQKKGSVPLPPSSLLLAS